jgi:hypothetical protein
MKAPMCGKLLVTARNGAVNVCIDRDGVIQTTVTVGNSIKETTP